MRDLVDILKAFRGFAPGETGVLASVVHAKGSTYRRIGARLLVRRGDEVIGLLSGGCLEGDIVSRASEVRASATPRVVRYDATANEDIVWGLGLGCAGIVDVLLEPVSADRPGPLAWLAAWSSERGTGVIATALQSSRLGRRFALHPDGTVEGAPGDEVLRALHRCRETGRSRRISTPSEGDVALEIARPPRRLVVLGAGPDSIPVARLAVELGWDVEIFDHRAAYARTDRFAGARVELAPTGETVSRARVDGDTWVLVMTHHYLADRTLLADLLRTDVPYIGLLGPKQRAEDLLADIEGLGTKVSPEQRARLHAPAGLDIGGDGPAAIALSLISEVMAAAESRSGGWLRDRKGPIHDPEPS